MSLSESPTSSQIMDSSHSSEGSSITDYVVVIKDDEKLQNSDSTSEDGKPAENPAAKSESLVHAGSMGQDELVERVQSLSKENGELKGVLLQNNKRLEEYFRELASMQNSQKQKNELLKKRYDQAREAVEKLRGKNATLKTELKNEQNKNLQLEEQMLKLKDKDAKLNEPSSSHDNTAEDDKGIPSHVPSLKEVIERLESEKDALEMCSKLQEHMCCLKAMREAEANTENDDCEALVSLGSLPSDIQVSPEVLQENYNKIETEKEILMVDFEKMKIENQQIQQQYDQLEQEHNELLKKLADMEPQQTLEVGDKQEIVDTPPAAATSEQVTELCQQLEVQTQVMSKLKEELDAVRQEKEMFKKKTEELEQTKGTTEKDDIESMKQQLQNYEEKEKEDRETAHKQAAFQAELMKETAELKQQLETEREATEKLRGEMAHKEAARQAELMKETAELKQHLETEREATEKLRGEMAHKQATLDAELMKLTAELETEREAIAKLKGELDNLRQERDGYKRKVEEFEMNLVESKASAEEVFGVVGDADLMARYEKEKKRVWLYQQREGNVLNRENAVLEKEEEYKQLVKEKENLELQLAEALRQNEALAQERTEQDEQSQTLRRQLSSVSDELSETHEHEVNQLREELQNTNTAMATVLTNGEQLKGNVTQLMEKNENLFAECEKLKAECTQREEEIQSLTKQLNSVSNELNETHEREVNQLQEELEKSRNALAAAETNMESLKVQVMQLIQENQSLMAERDRVMENCTQQENMYQDHLHKITDDSESQRVKRDGIIKDLKKQLAATVVELQNTRVKLETDSTVHQQFREEHERVVTEYEEVLQAYHTTRETNKQRENDENQARAASESYIKDLTCELKDSDNLLQKVKEDVILKEEELHNLRQDAYDLQKLQEKLPFLEAQLEVYRSDFQAERDAREQQHEEIMRLQQENRRLQDDIDQLNNRGMEELQRRHASFVSDPRDVQPQQQQQQQQQEQPRGWMDGMFPMFARGPMDPPEVPNPGSRFPNPEGEMRIPGRAQMGGDQREQRAPPAAEEEDWQCPKCRRVFPTFDDLQIHAVECNGTQAAAADPVQLLQCPSCMEVFPDYDTLEIHVEECLEQHQ